MTAIAETLIEQRKTNLTRRQLLAISTALPLAAVIALASPATDGPVIHKGSFSDDFTADFDVTRTEYSGPLGVKLNVTAHEVYATHPAFGRRLTLWPR